MSSAVLEIARHEVRVLAGTRRALWMAGLYLGAAIIGGGIYVSIVGGVENAAIEVMIQSGDDPSNTPTIDLAGQPAVQKIIGLFAGTDFEEMAPSLRHSLILPAFLWCSLAFLPFLVLATSFDQLASDLQTRALCYTVLRARRSDVVIGKLLAHAGVFGVSMAASSLVLMVLAGGAISTDSALDALPGLARLWLLLLPFGFVYLGLTSLASVVARQPSTALATALGLMGFLRILSWFGSRPEGDPLRWLRFLSPAHYHEGFWRAGVAAPLSSVAAYCLMGAIAVALAIWWLERQDL